MEASAEVLVIPSPLTFIAITHTHPFIVDLDQNQQVKSEDNSHKPLLLFPDQSLNGATAIASLGTRPNFSWDWKCPDSTMDLVKSKYACTSHLSVSEPDSQYLFKKFTLTLSRP